MDRLTSMTVFVRVVDSGGFSAAAKRLNMSTTAVSNHVQSLEERLAARLLNRTTRKIGLTEVGKPIMTGARESWPRSNRPTISSAHCNRSRAARCAST